jgi:hypothetical protein
MGALGVIVMDACAEIANRQQAAARAGRGMFTFAGVHFNYHLLLQAAERLEQLGKFH